MEGLVHDQPDNAERVRRLGIARTVPRHRYVAERAMSELSVLLGDRSYSERASMIGDRLRAEDGVKVACDAMEASMLRGPEQSRRT